MGKKVHDMRGQYGETPLVESQVGDDPVRLFSQWFDEAVASDTPEPNAMALATAAADGRPSVRIVLMKSFDADGLVFYTNFESRKGADLRENPHAALTFWWPPLVRQVRMAGTVTRLDDEIAATYFASRPRESKLGAWASRQSSRADGRDELERKYRMAQERFADPTMEIPKPPYWGGYLLRPSEMEFWQGRSGRLHDRLIFREGAAGWALERLQP